jgi:hypothetical protein
MALVVLVVVVVFLVVIAGIIFALFGSFGGVVWFAPLCVAFLVVIIVVIAAVSGAFRRTSLPPPPPIQQPMVPAGTQGPIALSCPNCGAPPVSVDRFGVATCTYCGTRFIVR